MLHLHYACDFPHILYPHDLAIMSEAYRLALLDLGGKEVDPHAVSRMILRFYQRGLVDRHKLATLAALAVAPRPSASAD